ncbi:sialidase family protein [Phytohabitans houttuyneae]|uniref:Sialidase domain-containing protein n=1 Tax=Phytohabitans houttuyneae TaxID=1076126 RepID=A0A6V8KLP1_9ACTN|nr:sialidase family protein [Phytohabitans houttuyneae]GFJ82856.1 hypothetical protein Phou_070360 [Phytohabitans houttuyneae]
MNDLRELFDEAVGTPPPSHLSAGEVYAAGRRRHRLRTASATAATVLAAVLVVGGGLLLPGRLSQSLPPADDPPTAATPAREPIQWAGAWDADHLYLTHLACPDHSCPKTTVRVRGSGDGGRTWTDRGEPVDAYGFAVAGPDTLVAIRPSGATGGRRLAVSTDGGRGWRVVRDAPAVDAVPAGGAVACWADAGEPCTLWALDPDGGTRAPLRHQPALLASGDDLLPQRSGGRIWVRGLDPATGRPAVAVSGDGGRTWSAHTFADAPACHSEGCRQPELATGGPHAYALAVGASARAVYRYADGDGWARVTGVDRVPTERLDTHAPSFVAGDGTHVLCETASLPDGRDGCRFWAARGGTYATVALTGLPATVYPIRRTAGGWFYTYSYTDRRLFGSPDGWTWSAISAR